MKSLEALEKIIIDNSETTYSFLIKIPFDAFLDGNIEEEIKIFKEQAFHNATQNLKLDFDKIYKFRFRKVEYDMIDYESAKAIIQMRQPYNPAFNYYINKYKPFNLILEVIVRWD